MKIIIPSTNSSKSVSVIQVDWWEKQSFFLSNWGELFACGSNDFSLLDCILEAKEEENEIWINKYDFLPDEIKDDVEEFINKDNEISEPKPIPLFYGVSEHRVSHISWGSKHIIAISTEKIAYSWGSNSMGQCGLGTTEDFVNSPNEIKFFEGIKVAAWAENHSMIISESGLTFFFGYNISGSSKEKSFALPNPECLQGIKNATFIAWGPNHNAVIFQSNELYGEPSEDLYMWGKGWEFKLSNYKKEIEDEIKPRMVSWGSKHTIFLDYLGNVWFWGKKSGVGIEDINNEYQTIPKLLLSPRDWGRILHVSSYHNKNLAVTDEGSVIYFGEKEENLIDKESEDNEDNRFNYAKSGWAWRKVEYEGNIKPSFIKWGLTHNILISSKGYPFAWGNNINGRCGITSNLNNEAKEDNSDNEDEDYDYNKFEENLEIIQPTLIVGMRTILKGNITKERNNTKTEGREEKDKDMSNSDDDEEKHMNYRFDSQVKLKKAKNIMSEENLKIEERRKR